jgi:hypothetical protein
VRVQENGVGLREGDHEADLAADIRIMLAQQKQLHDQQSIETAVIEGCKAWIASLPAATVLEPVTPVVEKGLSLAEARGEIKKKQAAIEALKRVPVPAADTQARAALCGRSDAAHHYRDRCGRDAQRCSGCPRASCALCPPVNPGNTQHDPCRASGLPWHTGVDHNSLLEAHHLFDPLQPEVSPPKARLQKKERSGL